MKKITSAILVLCFMVSCISPKAEATIFDDVSPRDWYYDAVMYLRTKDIVSGVDMNSFKPGRSTTRADFVLVLSRCVTNYKKPSIGAVFFDVPCDSYYYDAVQWGVYYSIVHGVDDHHFKPTKTVTREQAIKMIYACVKASGRDMETTPSEKQFADRGAVSPWAKEAMDWAIDMELINGDDQNRLNPQLNLTRAQLCMLVYNARDYLVDIELW